MHSIAELAPFDSHPLVASQLPSWYTLHHEHALKSVIIPLPPGFLQYLQEDGVFLPDDTAAVPQLAELNASLLTDGDYRRDDWDAADAARGAAGGAAPAGWPQPSPSGPLHSGREGLLSGSPHSSEEENNDNEDHRRRTDGRTDGNASSRNSGSDSGSEAADPRVLDWTARFPQLRAALDEAISSLGGRVVPKLNWSCPSDALWVSPSGSLACGNAEQVVLLLKSSDRLAAHDVALLAEAEAAAAAEEAEAEAATAATAATDADAEAAAVMAPSPSAAERPEDAADDAAAPEAGSGGGAAGAAACFGGRRRQPKQTEPGDQQRQQQSCGGGGSEAGSAAAGAAGGRSCGAGPGPKSSRHGAGSGALSGRGLLQPVLVLKRWYSLRPEQEFRCFVRAGQLVAVSQRDISQVFPALTAEAVVEARRRLWRFWRECVAGSLPLRDFAYDVYVPSDSSLAVRLVDVNPLTDTTSPLLYDWAELGFGPAEVPAAERLLQRLLRPLAAAAEAAPPRCTGSDVVADADDDVSWLEAAAAGLSALPLPANAEQLQVRIVEDPSRGARSAAAAPGTEAGGGSGAGSLAGLVGPMLLGSRGALAMPYDMLGIADSVDKLIEALQRQHRENKRRRERQQQRHGGGGGGGGGGLDDDNDGDDDDEGQDDSSVASSGTEDEAAAEAQPGLGTAAASQGADGTGGDDVGVGPSAGELAALFGGDDLMAAGYGDADDGLAGAGLLHEGSAENVEAQAVDMMDIIGGGCGEEGEGL